MPLLGWSVKDIKRMESKKDYNGLSKALIYREDPKIVLAAALALGRIGDDFAVSVLTSALKKDVNNSNLKSPIIEALAQNGVRLPELVKKAQKNSVELSSSADGGLSEESLASEAIDSFVARMREANEKSKNDSHKDKDK